MNIMNPYYDSPSENFLKEYRGNDLSAPDQKAIGNGELVIAPSYHYLNVDISASPNDLLKLSSVAVDGVNTFDKGATPQFENIVLKRLRVGHAKMAEAAKIGTAIFSNVVDADIDPAWYNAHLVLMQNRVELLKLPVRRLYNSAAIDRPLELQGLELDNWILIKSNQLLEVKLEYPEDVAVAPGAGNKFVVGIDFIGGMSTPK